MYVMSFAFSSMYDVPCLVYSIGNSDNFAFERDLHARVPTCEAHVFECKTDSTGTAPQFVKNHQWCPNESNLNSEDGKDESPIFVRCIYFSLIVHNECGLFCLCRLIRSCPLCTISISLFSSSMPVGWNSYFFLVCCSERRVHCGRNRLYGPCTFARAPTMLNRRSIAIRCGSCEAAVVIRPRPHCVCYCC